MSDTRVFLEAIKLVDSIHLVKRYIIIVKLENSYVRN